MDASLKTTKITDWVKVSAIALCLLTGLTALNLIVNVAVAGVAASLETQSDRLRIQTISYRWIKINCGQTKAKQYYEYLGEIK